MAEKRTSPKVRDAADELQRREAAALADDLHVDPEHAYELIVRATEAIAGLDVAQRFRLEVLRFQRDSADITRGLSARASSLFRRAAHAWDCAARDIATALAGSDTDLYAALRQRLNEPLSTVA
jgi:hypothetical protein